MKRMIGAAAFATAFALAAPVQAAAAPAQGSEFQFRLGGFFPSGDGPFWQANEDAFTLDHSDFDGPTLGVGYVGTINNYVEFGFGIDWYGETVRSADRYYTDQDGYPILHDTRLALTPITADIRFLPTGRYKERGPNGQHLVRHPVFYLGAGIGANYWRYEEEGDFVATDLSIVYDRLTASGFAFETHAMIGMEFPVSPRWNIYAEGRYSWSETTPGGPFDYVNPGRLDLGGTTVSIGGGYRF
jgi:opacity protein-like surface antigen